ncbi:MAG: hypothetical protein AAFO80_14490, partial [Pseudomonadota bacterium]
AASSFTPSSPVSWSTTFIENRRLNHPSDVLKEGQEVWVKLLGFDDRGKVRLSMKVVDQETGEEGVKEEAAE